MTLSTIQIRSDNKLHDWCIENDNSAIPPGALPFELCTHYIGEAYNWIPFELSVFNFLYSQYCILTGMWSRSRRLGLETVSRRTNVSSRSRLFASSPQNVVLPKNILNKKD